MRKKLLSLLKIIRNWASASPVEREHVRRIGWLALSAVLVPVGSAAALVAAFNDQSLVIIYLGFASFFTGYRLAQYGIHQRKPGQWLPRPRYKLITDIPLNEAIMVLGGGLAISYGFQVLCQSLLAADVVPALGSAALMFGGYMVTHLATNNTLI